MNYGLVFRAVNAQCNRAQYRFISNRVIYNKVSKPLSHVCVLSTWDRKDPGWSRKDPGCSLYDFAMSLQYVPQILVTSTYCACKLPILHRIVNDFSGHRYFYL